MQQDRDPDLQGEREKTAEELYAIYRRTLLPEVANDPEMMRFLGPDVEPMRHEFSEADKLSTTPKTAGNHQDPRPALRFEVLVELEPKLGESLAEARAIKDDDSARYFCRNELWYGYSPRYDVGIKETLMRLVGWHSKRRGLLASFRAYDLAYQMLYDALPPCRGECSC